MLTDLDGHPEDKLVLRLTVEHLLNLGEWPTLRDLHRRIHRDLGQEIDVRTAARRLDPHPFISAYLDLGDRFVPSLRVIGRIDEGGQFLDAVLTFIRHAKAKYLSSSEDAQVTEKELVEALGLDEALARSLRRLVDGIPFLTQGGGSGEGGWYINVSDDITRWRGVDSRQDLLGRLDEIEEEKQRESAALADAKHRMVTGSETGLDDAVSVDGRHVKSQWRRFAGWLETHPVVRVSGVIGTLVGVALGIIALIRNVS